MVETKSLPKMNVFLMIILTIVTLAIYIPVWFLRRRDWLNHLSSTKKLGSAAAAFLLIIYCISVLLLFLPNEVLAENIERLISLVGGIITLILAFRIRRILIQHFNENLGMDISFSWAGTFFFEIFYLQYKINRLPTSGETLSDIVTESEPATKKSKKPFVIGCGVAAFIIVGAVVALIVWGATGPVGGVRMSNEMERYALEYIEKHGLLNNTEELIAYYDVTILLDGSEAAILTTERVMYHKDGRTTSIDLEDIYDVRHRKEGIIGDIIEVASQSGKQLKIEIAPLNQGESFYNALMNAWNLRKSR